jgi:hypothetical protein
MASDPDASFVASSFIAATADELGVDPSSVSLDGISTDGDSSPGCSDVAGTSAVILLFTIAGDEGGAVSAELGAIASDPDAGAAYGQSLIAAVDQAIGG